MGTIFFMAARLEAWRGLIYRKH